MKVGLIHSDVSRLFELNWSKLKKIFNTHITTNGDKIHFSEFIKFCKQTLIFPNFISTVTLKQYEKNLTSKSLMTFQDFEHILKEVSLVAFKSNISKQEKVSAFLRHLNINC